MLRELKIVLEASTQHGAFWAFSIIFPEHGSRPIVANLHKPGAGAFNFRSRRPVRRRHFNSRHWTGNVLSFPDGGAAMAHGLPARPSKPIDVHCRKRFDCFRPGRLPVRLIG